MRAQNRPLMKRTLAIVTMISLIGVLAPAPTASAAPTCEKPIPVLTYEADRIDITLEVDYTGCKWWRKSSIDMVGELNQGPLFGVGVGVSSSCFVFSEGRRRAIARWCEINLSFNHLAVEAVTYSGYFEYPWKNGTARIEFEYLCASAAAAAQCEEI